MKTGAVAVQKSRAAHVRRQRGYNWEDTIVKRFNKADGWRAFRLGSPSIGLPDVVAVSTRDNRLCIIEAKSGTTASLPVPYDQIQRCIEWSRTFDVYKTRDVILAFKFSSKRRIGQDTYESRELREFFKVWDQSLDVTDCVCTYDGGFFAKVAGTRRKVSLKEAEIPFKTRNRKSF